MPKEIKFKNFIIKIAVEAGEILRKKFGKIRDIKFKDKFGDPVTEADYASEKHIISAIRKKFPSHNILSEEDGNHNRQSDYLWIIDPLDGTSNFTMEIPFFCVSIAVARANQILAGVIYNPIHNELFFAEKGDGAFLNNKKIVVSKVFKPMLSRVMMAWNGINAETLGVLKTFSDNGFVKARAIGSAALGLAYVAAGRGDAYVSLGCKLWDVAAGVIIISEAGAKISDIFGKKWNFQSPTLVAANKILHSKIIK
ncbi:MAG: inositol monophosphatase family protein [Patescibacteria group bacterium]